MQSLPGVPAVVTPSLRSSRSPTARAAGSAAAPSPGCSLTSGLHFISGCHKAHHKCTAECTLGKERPAVVLIVIMRFLKLASRKPGAIYLKLLHLPPEAGSCPRNLSVSAKFVFNYELALIPAASMVPLVCNTTHVND